MVALFFEGALTSFLSVFTFYKSINLWLHDYQTCFYFAFSKKMLQFYTYFLHLEESNFRISCPHQRYFYQTDDSINDCFIVGCTITLKVKYGLNRVANVAAVSFSGGCIDQRSKYWFAPLMSCIALH